MTSTQSPLERQRSKIPPAAKIQAPVAFTKVLFSPDGQTILTFSGTAQLIRIITADEITRILSQKPNPFTAFLEKHLPFLQ